MKNTEYKKIAQYCKENWKEETVHVLRVADEVCENFFLFDMSWDMERTYEPVIFKGEIDWEIVPRGDKEFIWQFNRHRFLIILGQAYQLTTDTKYAKHFIRLLTDWITRTPLTNKNTDSTWRSLEVGLRGEYWLKAMEYFEECSLLTPAFRKMVIDCLKVHAKLLRETHIPYHCGSNWGVIQDHGLFAIALELGNQEDITLALTRLAEESRLQIMQDGVHWEQSSMYHNEVMNCFLDVIMRARRANISIPQELIEQTKKMAYVNLKWIKPNFHQPLFGDSDNTDLRESLTLTAYMFSDPILKSMAYQNLDYETVWMFGMDAVNQYANIAITLPDYKSVLLDGSGCAIMRSDWGQKANYMRLHNGYTGAGHAHADKLHVDLSILGEDVLTDSGRYTYVDNKERKYLKMIAHNISTVGNRPFMRAKGWAFFKLAPSVKQGLTITKDIEIAEGGHLGYMRLLGGVYVNRRVVWIKPDIYILLDDFVTHSIHRYQQYFHFNKEGSITVEGNKAIYQGKTTKTEFVFFAPHCKLKQIKSQISYHYNLIEDNSAIKTSFCGIGNTSAITVIHGKEISDNTYFAAKNVSVKLANANVIALRSMAEAVVINVGEVEYTVIVAHKEMMTPLLANGKYGVGKITIYRGNDCISVIW